MTPLGDGNLVSSLVVISWMNNSSWVIEILSLLGPSAVVVDRLSSHGREVPFRKYKFCIFMRSSTIVVDGWSSRGWITLLGR